MAEALEEDSFQSLLRPNKSVEYLCNNSQGRYFKKRPD